MKIRNFDIKIGGVYYTRWQESKSILALKLERLEHMEDYGFYFEFSTPSGEIIPNSYYVDNPRNKYMFLYETADDAIYNRNCLSYEDFKDKFCLACNELRGISCVYKWDGYGCQKVSPILEDSTDVILSGDSLKIIPHAGYFETPGEALEGHEIKIIAF